MPDDQPSVQIPVPIQMRSHEVNQIREFVPELCGDLQRIDTESTTKASAELQRIYDEHLADIDPDRYPEDHFADWASMPIDDWRLLIRHMARLRRDHGLRAWWLRQKLARRLDDRLEEMEGDDGE